MPSRPRRTDDVPGRRAIAVLTLARLSHAQWFFVNLYEAVVRMPTRLAAQHDDPHRPASRGPLGRGSPARYHVPAAPVVLGSAIGAVVTTRRAGDGRRATAVAAASSLCATALTGYLVRTVNLRLFDDGAPIEEDELRRLVGRWHAVNRIRLALLAAATLGFEHAARNRRSFG